MATKRSGGPQHRIAVTLLGRDGATTGTATCFFSIWEERAEGRWRGFLVAIDPPSAVARGEQHLRFPSGETGRVEITRMGSEGKIQAIFQGRGTPPRVDVRRAAG